MMRTLKSWSLMALAAAATLAISAPAAADTWTDTVGYLNTNGATPPGGWTPVLVNSSNSYSYTHSIVGDAGFVPNVTQIYDVQLQIWLADDAGGDSWYDGTEYFQASWSFGSWTTSLEVDGNIFCSWWSGCDWDDFEFSPSNSRLADGILDVTIRATQGDFYFKRSQLTVTGRTYKVPEPATLALMGMGLMGVGFASRRRRKSASA